jgi:pSer/pThr/pTyr-binding forkhead associated (FHA) protein
MDDAGAKQGAGVLVLCDGEFVGAEYRLTAEETLIGRNPTTDITLLDESISREHAVILYDADSGSFTIEDLQSTNSTKVNGKRIRSVALQHGDEIEIGHTRFRFLSEDTAA